MAPLSMSAGVNVDKAIAGDAADACGVWVSSSHLGGMSIHLDVHIVSDAAIICTGSCSCMNIVCLRYLFIA